ncbi:hypothetical protein GDO86_014906 [Hymenochirus boettgeri]|uniref:Uncharacterized protein n=1 Tax=Hymenochirus boettgeri TaxID=247094 RepID=A0A8T2JZ08_9PIPI|nr:hypothetical protein GDO86_014906 [Hymenochirus boettgeri]
MTLSPWLAPIVWDGTYNLDILNEQFHQRGVRIGLTTFVIRKYKIFIQNFLQSAEKFFMTGHKVSYYVFTDDINAIPNINLREGRSLEVLKVTGYKRWQDITMRRMQLIRDLISERVINEVDYIVCVDVDFEFRDSVGVEILSDIFGVLHSDYFEKKRQAFTYERRDISAGYIPNDEGDFYYIGGFFGGTVKEVYKLTNHCHNAMMQDKAINIEALWHDESYVNRYFLYHKPTKILSPEYTWNYFSGNPAVVKRKRVVHVPKQYSEVRD